MDLLESNVHPDLENDFAFNADSQVFFEHAAHNVVRPYGVQASSKGIASDATPTLPGISCSLSLVTETGVARLLHPPSWLPPDSL
eukprot:240720-Rhodomonas_salina.1